MLANHATQDCAVPHKVCRRLGNTAHVANQPVYMQTNPEEQMRKQGSLTDTNRLPAMSKAVM